MACAKEWDFEQFSGVVPVPAALVSFGYLWKCKFSGPPRPTKSDILECVWWILTYSKIWEQCFMTLLHRFCGWYECREWRVFMSKDNAYGMITMKGGWGHLPWLNYGVKRVRSLEKRRSRDWLQWWRISCEDTEIAKLFLLKTFSQG